MKMTTYKIIIDAVTNKEFCILKDDSVSIPFDPANTDYQEYLKWVAEGNEPLPADE